MREIAENFTEAGVGGQHQSGVGGLIYADVTAITGDAIDPARG